MSKVKTKKRKFIIAKNRKRAQKLKKLKGLYLASKDKKEREKISLHIQKIAPHLAVEQYLG